MEVLESSASDDVWVFVWQTFANASLTYDLVSSQNGTRGNIEDSAFWENPAKLGILTGFVIACLADFRIATPKFQLDAGLDSRLKTLALALINVFTFFLLAPIISTTMIVLFVYRKIVEFALEKQLRDEFAGLLEGTDCVWALEESTALSVINVLAVLEQEDSTADENFLLDFRNLIKNRLLTSSFDKLNWLREKKYGYYYWRRSDEAVGIEERVRWLDDDDDDDDDDDERNHEECAGNCDDVNGEFLKSLLAKASNKPLPWGHSASWEILIVKSCALSAAKRLEEMEEGVACLDDANVGRKKTISVLFRVHHCLGDGVALLRLLLESIADSNSINGPAITLEAPSLPKSNPAIRVPLLRASSSITGTLRNENEIVYYANDLLNASMPFATRIPLSAIVKSVVNCINEKCKILKSLNIDDLKGEIINKFWNSWMTIKVHYLESIGKEVNKLAKTLVVLISSPSCFVQQALRSMDNSALHGPILTGDKIVSWWIERESTDQSGSDLLSKIRDIKNATGTRFGDVILTALSANLHRYFAKIGEAAPKNMTVVIPARMTMPAQKLSLQNGFSVGLLSLCVSEVNGEAVEGDLPEDSRLLERLGDVSRCSEKLRKDPDYLINFWVMKWLAAALPECILRPVLESHSTMVFSNLPGPQEVAILGSKVKNVAFWIPHRCKTGIGCSFLTYGGRVHVSLVADTALVKSQRLLDEILRDTVEDIEKLYETVSMSCFSMNLKDRLDAPTETELGVL